jgi:hypothetical protein
LKPTLRASEIDRVLSCNGSLTLTRLVAPRAGTEGDEGTDIHLKTAWRLVTEAGAYGNGFPNGFNYAPGNHLNDWMINFLFRTVIEETPADWSLECEAALAYSWDRFNLSGHPDVVALNPDVTEFRVDDFKTGYIPVDIAEQNWQLLVYACLLKRAYPTLRRGKVRIIQPRNDEDEGFPRVSEAMIEDIDKATAGLEARINAALDNAMEVNSGMAQCRWCPASIQCPALQLELEHMKATLTPESLARVKREPNDAQLADWVIAARTLNRPTEDATAMLHERLDKQDSIAAGCGITITRKIQKGSYTIDKPVEFFKAAKEILVTDEHMAAAYKPSMTRLVDEVATVMDIPKGGKASVTAQSVVDGRFKPFVTQGEKRILQFS